MQPNTYQTAGIRDLSLMQRMGAMRDAEAALRRDPKNVAAMLNMASLLAAATDLTGAIEWLRRALGMRKNDPDILRRIVHAADDARMRKVAINHARKLCEVQPRLPENHETHARLLESAGFQRRGIEAYEKALKLSPNDPKLLHAIGRCHGHLGDHAKALEYYRMVLAIDPQSASALHGVAESHKFAADEVDAFAAKALGASEAYDDYTTKALLYYSTGKAFDDAKRFDEAFACFQKANALSGHEQVTEHRRHFANLKAAFSRRFFLDRAGKGYGSDSRRPIFIVGMPRSGTTLTESICGAHSQVTAGDEMSYMLNIVRALGLDQSDPAVFAASVARIKQENTHEIAQDYLGKASQTVEDAPRFTDKLPHNFLFVGMIGLILPAAKVIHVRRHPLDCALSHYSNSMGPLHNSYKTDLVQFGLYYRQYLQLMQHWRETLPGFMHEVYYEDLVANTELSARAMIGYLGLPWEDGVMDRTRSQRSVRTISVWQVRQPVYQSSKGKWKSYEKHLGPLIETLGPTIGEYEEELAALDAAKAG